jgi:hypothetical protein
MLPPACLLGLALLMTALVLFGTTLKSHVLVTADLRPHDVLWNLAQHRPRQQEEARRRAIDYVQQYGALEGREYPRECQDLYHGVAYFAHVQASWQQPVCEPQVWHYCGFILSKDTACALSTTEVKPWHC